MALLNFDESEVSEILADPHVVLGLGDGGAHMSQLCDACHPTYLLGHWVRERRALSLEEAVRRLSSHPADVFGLHDRGRVAPGLPADLVVNAHSPDGLIMGMHHRELPLHGVQFHPESIATQHGHRLLANFMTLAGLKPDLSVTA